MPRRTITRSRRPSAALAALLVAGLLVGCGADSEGPATSPSSGSSSSPTAAVRAVVLRFGAASRAKDYQTICDQLLSRSLVTAVESIGLPCEAALQRGLAGVRDPQLTVRQISIHGNRALASVHSTAFGQPPSDDAMQLVLEDGTWRIASLAEPSAAAPTSATPGSSATPASSATPPSTTTTSPTKSKKKG
ncbi:MAG: hypothetical protein ACXWN5_02180 [Candidatus Limnocylindrales bacterium]